jgi:hypothetical protein
MNFRLLILLCILCPLGLWSQTGTISGFVQDPDKNPVPSVLIYEKTNQNNRVFSDSEGGFKISIPANRDITLVLNFPGIPSSEKMVRVDANEDKIIVVTFDATQEKAPVVITERRRPVSIIRINPKLATPLPTPQGGIEGYLLQAPVNFSSELSSSYSVRGGSFDENLVYVNDIQVYRPFLVRSGEQEGLSFPNADMVESINFSAGGFDAKYGDKMSSVLDITYARPDSFAVKTMMSLLGANLTVQGISKNQKFTHNTGIRYKRNTYLLNSLDVDAEYDPRYTDIQSYVTYRPQGKYGPWEFSFLGNYSKNNYNFIPRTRETDVGTINEALRLTVFFEGQEETQFETYFGAFSTRYNPSELSQLRFTVSAFQTYESEHYDILGAYRLDELERDLGSDEFGEVLTNRGVGAYLDHARNDLEASVFSFTHRGFRDFDRTNHFVQWGTDLQIEKIYDELNEWSITDSAGYASPRPNDNIGYTDPSGRPIQGIAIQDRIRAVNEVNSSRTSAFVQDNYTFKNDSNAIIGATVGVRANHWSYNNELVVSPRAKFSYTPFWNQIRKDKNGDLDTVRKDIVLSASLGYYYQPPFYREMRGFDGAVNPDIRAQRSIHFILGADYVFQAWNRPIKMIAEVYYKKLDNLIPYELENVRQRYFAENIAKGYAYGADLMLNGEFIDGVQSWVRMSYLKTEEDLSNDFYYLYFNAAGDTIRPGYTTDLVRVDSLLQTPGYIPRPSDQRFSFSLLFLDEMPRKKEYKVLLTLFFGTGVPYGPPTRDRYQDILRTKSYFRTDIGFSRDLFLKKKKNNAFNRNIDKGLISLEVFNLLGVNNTINYQWIEDVNGRQYGIPTYLTGRRINLRFVLEF